MQKLIIFDCDGVLVDSEPLSNQVIAGQMNELGIEMSTEEALQLFAGTSLKRVGEYVRDRTGKALPDTFEVTYRERSYALFREKLQAVPGVVEVLNTLDLPKCVASNGPLAKMELNLGLTGLLPFFAENMFSAYELNAWKPDPTLFLHAAKTMGYAPQDCIVIEDSIHGVEAAQTAGMQILAYDRLDYQGKLKSAGVPTFQDMEALPHMIENS